MTENDRLDEVYETILSRDTKYDGIYFIGIASTKIYCRPSCRSRTPKKENVTVYESAKEAEKAGFRACKRCKPETAGQHGPDSALAESVKKVIMERYAEPLTLSAMAVAVKVSAYHLHRVFKRETGLTPAQYLLQFRISMAKELLKLDSYPVGETARKTGFKNPPHFSSVFKKTEGCTPLEYRNKQLLEEE
ncbi:helix-turn-helix domain-containing protein [Bacillus mangrovi]|uniref:Helix-turn-helix domain-containing protein n=1 Tax=Metabacillus mangrovi TaxID=1491830 RepID=A0A7X2S136_9BACI|nr:Ada metal-binding domain-containing protein [Metabacillus mangrovi]MTH51939.1 helix-turn-helix domain-containing protein [Metabacillus mangrovi]